MAADWLDSIVASYNAGNADAGINFNDPATSGADFGPAAKVPVARNGAAQTGFNLLIEDPASFFRVLFGGSVDKVPAAAVEQAANHETPLPGTLTIALIVAGIFGAAYIAHKAL